MFCFSMLKPPDDFKSRRLFPFLAWIFGYQVFLTLGLSQENHIKQPKQLNLMSVSTAWHGTCSEHDVSNLCGMRKMQHFLRKTIGGSLTGPMPDEGWVYLRPMTLKAPMKKMNISIMRFWHGICTNPNSQNFVDWRAI